MGNSSIAIGSNTGSVGPTKATQNYAVAIGDGARALGESSTALGDASLANAIRTVAIGLRATATNDDSISIGTDAKNDSSNGVAIGKNSYVMRSGGIAIGSGARSGSSNSTIYGDYAVTIGYNSGAGSDYGVSIGYNAGNTNKGTSNIAIGTSACKYVSGSHKTCIGEYSGPKNGSTWASSSDNTERIFIGSQSKFDNGTAVLEVHNTTKREPYIRDYDINETAVVVHGSLIVTGPIYNNVKDKEGTWRHWQLLEVDKGGDKALWSKGTTGPFFREYIKDSNVPTQNPAPSDRRLKNVGKEFTSGLDKIRQLKVFNYTFKKDDKKTPHVGVIAQDLQKVFPNAVKKGADGFLTIRMEDMFYAMINAIKELDLKYQAQEKRINDLEKQMKLQDKRLKQLEAKIK